MPNGWRTIKSLVHKIWHHGRRGEGMAESFSREKLRHVPQKEGGWEILCDLPPVWPRLVRPTNLMSRMNGKKTHTLHCTILYCTRYLVRSRFLANVNPATINTSKWKVFVDKRIVAGRRQFPENCHRRMRSSQRIIISRGKNRIPWERGGGG